MRPEDDLFPRWWVALAVTLLGAWLVYAVAMTVHAWPLIAGMAARNPDAFDRILSAAVEKITSAD